MREHGETLTAYYQVNEGNLKRYMHPNVHTSAIYNTQDMEAN